VLTRPNRDRGEVDHVWPEFLPGGRALLFTITMTTGGIDNSQIAALDLQTGTQKILVRGGSHAHYMPTGHLVYGAAGTARAVRFSLEKLEAVGTPTPVLPEVLTTQFGAAGFDVARDGTLVYTPGGAQLVARTLVWVDREGREEPISAPVRSYTYPRISPDGRQIALDIRDQESDIWTWEFSRATLTRVTFDATLDRSPVWSPDGRQLFFSSDRVGAANLYRQSSDSPGVVERLTQSPNNQFATGVSPDGTRVVYWEQGMTRDVMMLTLEKSPSSPARPQNQSQGSTASSSGAQQSLVQTQFNELNGEISPDGRWLAFQADDSGQDEIYVRPFPAVSSARSQVSTGGGTRPLWAPSGQELFFLTSAGALMSVRVNRGPTWDAGSPAKLFEGSYFVGGAANTNRTYDISPDGRRFLMIKPQQTTGGAPHLVVVENWFEELKRLVPAN
jgi:serine/threonine-protein kinase